MDLLNKNQIKLWKEEARRYAENADYWRGKHEKSLSSILKGVLDMKEATIGLKGSVSKQEVIKLIEAEFSVNAGTIYGTRTK